MLKTCILEIPEISLIILLQRACTHSFDFNKSFLFFSFYLPCQKQESTIIESLKFTGTIFKILKSQYTISLAKIALTKRFNFKDLSCCDKFYKNLYANTFLC